MTPPPPGREHDLGGEEGGLLGRERPGPEVDVVGAERDAGELAVGEGVLGGEPAAGQDAGVAGLRAGRGRRRRTPRATTRAAASPSSSRICG